MVIARPSASSAARSAGAFALSGSLAATRPTSLPPAPTNITVAPFPRKSLGRVRKRCGVDAIACQQFGPADIDHVAADRAFEALAGHAFEAFDRRAASAPFPLLPSSMAWASGWALVDFQRRGQRQHVVFACAVHGAHGHEPRLSFGHGAGLVDDEGVGGGKTFERLRVAHQHAGLRAARRRRPSPTPASPVPARRDRR